LVAPLAFEPFPDLTIVEVLITFSSEIEKQLKNTGKKSTFYHIFFNRTLSVWRKK
jgi:hypothetical protein